MALDITKFIGRFIDEAREQISHMDDGFKALESGQSNNELINSLFRAAHTLKGSSRMLKLLPISDTAHSMEDVLSALRDQSITLDDSLVGVLYQALDSLSDLTEHLAEHRDPHALPPANQALCAQLQALAQGQADAAPADSAAAPAQETPTPNPASTPAAQTAAPLLTESPQSAEPPATERAEPVLRSADSVRLKLDNLDQLVKLMSEITISHAGLRELVHAGQQLRDTWQQQPSDPELANALFERYEHMYFKLRDIVGAQESLIYSVHEQSLGLRMLPLSQVFDPARKLVRDLARELDKSVDMQVTGDHIELDRQLIEQITEPIQHVLRNALDHGMETPEQRLAAGKPAKGLMHISAQQDGGWVVLDITDDGAGINLDKVREKILRQQLLTADELANKSEHELNHLVFLPGFSTSSIITELSGRGVGLDVVKRCVDELHGQVAVYSQAGKGTTFRFRLPTSLAMMRVLLVEVAGHYVGVTAQYVVELTRIQPDSIIKIAERNVFVMRNEFVPIFDLGQLLKLPERRQSQRADDAARPLLLLIVRVQQEKIALQINRLVDERDLVIKQLPAHLAGNPMIAGMVNHGYQTLVSLINVPHVLALAQHSRDKSAQQSHQPAARQHILVVDDSLNTREIEKDMLEAWGYQVTLAEDGQEGLNKARAGDFDAVLTDVEMPIMDGFTLTSHLRQEERYKNCPIIIITSREKESDRRRGIEVGADAYIVKGSFDQNNLIDTLRLLLG